MGWFRISVLGLIDQPSGYWNNRWFTFTKQLLFGIWTPFGSINNHQSTIQ